MSERVRISNKIQDRLEPFGYSIQRLAGRLGSAMDINFKKGLLRIPYHDYLDAYQPGVPAFWPSGEYLGKFLHGLAKGFEYSGSPEALAVMQRIVNTWLAAQEPDGYVATHPRGYGVGPRWNDWAVWDHKYTLIGLLNYYATIGYAPALDCAARIGDLFAATFGEGEGRRSMLAAQHHVGLADGSVLEPMVELYRYTGDARHLAVCEYILRAFETEGGPRIVSELTQRSGRVDRVGNAKGYEMLSCIIGILRMYHLTGEPAYLRTATIAWDDIATNRLYVTGTSTAGEKFDDNQVLPAGPEVKMGEGCVTAHWIYLSRSLFYLTGDPKYVEELEKALYNHLLASQNPWTAHQSYYTPLMGGKAYNMPNLYGGEPPCCISSVQRCLARTPEAVWARFRDNGLAVMLYNPGTLHDTIRTADGSDVRVHVDIRGDYPANGEIDISVSPRSPARFRLALRVPAWTARFEVEGAEAKTMSGEPGQFLDVERLWQPNDRIRIHMDMTPRIIAGGPSYPGHAAIKRGPLVLALGSDVNPGLNLDDVRIDPAAGQDLCAAKDRLPVNWLGGQAYTCPAVRGAAGESPLLVPFADVGQMSNRDRYQVWIKETVR